METYAGTQVVMLWAICEEGVQSGGAFSRQLEGKRKGSHGLMIVD